jgi:hypothetical protein
MKIDWEKIEQEIKEIMLELGDENDDQLFLDDDNGGGTPIPLAA